MMASPVLIPVLSVCLTGLLVSGQNATSYRIEQRLQILEAKLTQITDSLNETEGFGLTPVKYECPSGFYEHEATQSCYRIISDEKSWYEARVDCQKKGAHLVWFDTIAEYRHVVITLLTDIAADKDYNNTGYWSSANDITGGSKVWDDTDTVVPSFFVIPGAQSYRYGYSSRRYTSATKKHCVFLKYQSQKMQISQELSECDGERLYICKCKTNGKGRQGCSPKVMQPKLSVL